MTFLGGVGRVPPGTSAYLTADLEAGTTDSFVEAQAHARAEFTPR